MLVTPAGAERIHPHLDEAGHGGARGQAADVPGHDAGREDAAVRGADEARVGGQRVFEDDAGGRLVARVRDGQGVDERLPG